MKNNEDFLIDKMRRPWISKNKHGIRPVGLFIGNGPSGIEVVVGQSSRTPTRVALLEIWKERRARRATPVLLIVLHPSGAELCGATGTEPPVYSKVNPGQIERLCREVLDQPDRHAGLRFLGQALPSLETDVPGLNNEGLAALHELLHGVPSRSDWRDAEIKSRSVLGRRDSDLLTALGFQIERLDNLTHLLRSATDARR